MVLLTKISVRLKISQYSVEMNLVQKHETRDASFIRSKEYQNCEKVRKRARVVNEIIT